MQRFESEDDKLLLARVLDQKRICSSKNKITNTVFLNSKEQMLVKKSVKLENSFEFGGIENAERKIIVFFPEKLTEEIAKKNVGSIVSCIRIDLPNENFGKFEHKMYLSALMKIGLERERIGDILVEEQGADIIILKNNIDYTIQSLRELTRFKKANIYEISLEEIREKKENFEEIQIVISSMRIDSLVSEIAGCSRSKALEYVEDERVFINYEVVSKTSKMVNIGDIVTIRGKGKFIVFENLRSTRSGNIVLLIKKYA